MPGAWEAEAQTKRADVRDVQCAHEAARSTRDERSMDFESEDESDGARTNDEACAGVRPEDHDVSESDGCIATLVLLTEATEEPVSGVTATR